MSGVVHVNPYSAGWLRKGFPWVYPKEVHGRRPRKGQRVDLQDADGTYLGTGIADDGWIAVRVLRHDDGPVDRDWLFGVLDRALGLRQQLFGPDTTGYRICNAENDGLPGIRIDWWSHYGVVILDTPSLAGLVDGVAAWLTDRLNARGVYLCYRPDSRDDRKVADFSPPPGLVSGVAASSDVTVLERGLRLRARPSDGPDVGVYSDMRDVRAWLEPHWGGTTVLNTFAYTGAFSVAAAVNGASDVVTVDLAGPYLERAEDNFRANDLDPGMHRFIESDTFDVLDRFRRSGETFDRIILDPPSFSRTKDGRIWNSKKDMPRLVASAARVASDNGWLVVCSNRGELSPRDFRGLIHKGIAKAGRKGQEIYWGGQASDFPWLTTFPEGRYLKVGVFRVFS